MFRCCKNPNPLNSREENKPPNSLTVGCRRGGRTEKTRWLQVVCSRKSSQKGCEKYS